MELITALWLLIALLCLLGELAVPGISFFFALCCAAGVAGAVSWFAYNLEIQLLAFVAVTGFTGVMLQMIARRQVRTLRNKTNIDALVGRQGIIVEIIRPYAKGMVKVGGEMWSARNDSGEEMEVDSLVEVVAVIGSHLVVKRKGIV